jgi:Aminopeptidase N
MESYLAQPTNSSKHLVRFQYADKEDMFDGVSYQKGGRILNMLRQYLGDSAFFKGLNVYLTTNKFKNAEAHQLRLAMEEVSGKDLNWFFDQWFFGNGHPKVGIHYQFIDSANQLNVIVEQKQKDKLFYFPVEIDVYNNNNEAERATFWIGKQAVDTIRIAYSTKPVWVNVDPQKLMLWEKDNNQDDAMWIAQSTLGKNHLDKTEALNFLAKNWKAEPAYAAIAEKLLQDPYAGTRKALLRLMKRGSMPVLATAHALIEKMVVSEPDLPTRALAIDVLSMSTQADHENLFVKALTDSSYSVAGAALESLARKNASKAIALAPQVEKDAKGRLEASLKIIEYLKKDVSDFTTVLADYRKLPMFDRLMSTNGMLYFANQLKNLNDFKKATGSAIEAYKMLRIDYMGLQTNIAATLRWMIAQRQTALLVDPDNNVLKDQLKYLQEKAGL